MKPVAKVLLLGIAVLAVGLGTASASSHCDTTVADGDSIQAAVDAASAGDTVCVEAGTYDESVDVDKSVTLEGPNAGVHGASDARGPEAIVKQGVEISADGVTLDGLQVENTGQDGIAVRSGVSDGIVKNTRVTNVDGESHSFGGAGNGINIQPPQGSTVEGFTIRDNEISSVGAPSPDPRAKGVDVRVSWQQTNIEITNVEIRGNVITGIETDQGDGRAIGIHADINGPSSAIDGLTVAENEITGLNGEDATGVFITETPGWMSSPRIGPTNFEVVRNGIDDLNPQGGNAHALFVGGYEELGSGHEVTLNNFRDGAVERWDQQQNGFDPGAADTLDAESNYWGHSSGPSARTTPSGEQIGQGVDVIGDVDWQPFRSAPVGQAATDTPTPAQRGP